MWKQKILTVAALAALSTTAMAFPSLDSVAKGVVVTQQACTMAGKNIDEKGLASVQKDLLANTKKVSQNYLGAQLMLAEALDLKEQTAILKAQADTLKKGSTNADKLEKVTTVGADAGKAIEAQLKKMDKLSEAQKKKVSESLAKYGSAALGTAQVAAKTVAASGVVVCLASQDPVGAVKLKNKFGFVADAALTLPSFSKDLVTTGFSYAKLLKSFDVDTSAFEKQLKQAAKIKIEK